ncbi:transcriptional regulator [Gluconobacter albidus]|uniref:transcriptional regulator n=1 Tax=Gluconobacter albidus TaxID=318683 RepID=UPI0030DA8C7A
MENVIDHAISQAGGVSRLAKEIGISPASVCGWRKRGLIPVGRIHAVERITGLGRETLRPDIFLNVPEKAA